MFTLAQWITATRCVDFIDQWLDPVHRGQEAILLVLGPVDLNISREGAKLLPKVRASLLSEQLGGSLSQGSTTHDDWQVIDARLAQIVIPAPSPIDHHLVDAGTLHVQLL